MSRKASFSVLAVAMVSILSCFNTELPEAAPDEILLTSSAPFGVLWTNRSGPMVVTSKVDKSGGTYYFKTRRKNFLNDMFINFSVDGCRYRPMQWITSSFVNLDRIVAGDIIGFEQVCSDWDLNDNIRVSSWYFPSYIKEHIHSFRVRLVSGECGISGGKWLSLQELQASGCQWLVNDNQDAVYLGQRKKESL